MTFKYILLTHSQYLVTTYYSYRMVLRSGVLFLHIDITRTLAVLGERIGDDFIWGRFHFWPIIAHTHTKNNCFFLLLLLGLGLGLLLLRPIFFAKRLMPSVILAYWISP